MRWVEGGIQVVDRDAATWEAVSQRVGNRGRVPRLIFCSLGFGSLKYGHGNHFPLLFSLQYINKCCIRQEPLTVKKICKLDYGLLMDCMGLGGSPILPLYPLVLSPI